MNYINQYMQDQEDFNLTKEQFNKLGSHKISSEKYYGNLSIKTFGNMELQDGDKIKITAELRNGEIIEGKPIDIEMMAFMARHHPDAINNYSLTDYEGYCMRILNESIRTSNFNTLRNPEVAQNFSCEKQWLPNFEIKNRKYYVQYIGEYEYVYRWGIKEYVNGKTYRLSYTCDACDARRCSGEKVKQVTYRYDIYCHESWSNLQMAAEINRGFSLIESEDACHDIVKNEIVSIQDEIEI